MPATVTSTNVESNRLDIYRSDGLPEAASPQGTRAKPRSMRRCAAFGRSAPGLARSKIRGCRMKELNELRQCIGTVVNLIVTTGNVNKYFSRIFSSLRENIF